MVEQKPQEHAPSLKDLVEKAKIKFAESDNFVNQYGTIQGYESVIVAEEVVERAGTTSLELLATLIKQTQVTPAELHLDGIEETDWNEFFSRLSTFIITCELEKGNPEIIVESDRRAEEFWIVRQK